jgi:phosphoribosylamine--glycine ligase
MLAIIDGSLDQLEVEWGDEACVGVVLASGGYPGSYNTGYAIAGLDRVDQDVLVFHSGTKANGGRILTDGGRVLTVASTGETLAEARAKVYRNVPHIQFDGCHYRRDIAAREVES